MPGSVDIVIPTRNTRSVTLRCVEALLHEPHEPQVRCIVVDNGSTDRTAEAIRQRHPEVEVVRFEADLGYGRACNLGAARGTSAYVLILNSDAFAREGAVARLVGFLDTHPEHVIAAGRLVDPGGDRAQVGFAMRSFPTLARQVALMLGLERYWPRNPISRRQLMLDFDYGRTQDVEAQPAGACLLCRRTAFDSVGGFDEGFFYWFEDVDLVRRMRRLGPVAYVHDAVFEHLRGTTFGQRDRPEVVLMRYAGLLRYFRKHHRPWELAVLRLTIGILAALRSTLLIAFDRKRAVAYAAVVGLAARGD